MRKNNTHWTHGPEKGHSLFMVAAALFVLLGISALAIDLAKMYVVRNEAQRTADAAALAGAKKFIDSGYISGLVPQATAEAIARQEAIAVAAQNLVSGDPAVVLDADVTFDFSEPQNPMITVLVQRLISRSTGVPTFFAKAVGITEVDVGAVATAEAYTPTGGGLPIGTSCIKPWILPNCDPLNGDKFTCTVPFVNESDGSIINTGIYSPGGGGTIGMPLVLKPGDPNSSETPAPSQFYPIQIPPGTEPALCPDCSGPETGSDGPGAALYRHNIECCNTATLTCGQNVPADLSTGNMVGPTQLGVQCLIHQAPSGFGQDILDTVPVPFQIEGGSNNPNPNLQGQIISSSDSIITLPIYNGDPLTPGLGGESYVTIIGFLQVFINNVEKGAQGTVNATILNVAGCGAGGSGGGTGGETGGGGSTTPGGGVIVGPGGSLFPVRLVRTPTASP